MHNKKRSSVKAGIVIMAILLTVIVAAGTTLAILLTQTGRVENTFTPSEVTVKVVESFDNTTKSNVKIQNTGNIDAYIRAAVVINWKDASGNMLGETPVAGEGKDYSITYNESAWLKIGDSYYHKTVVTAGGTTENLIENATALQTKTVDGVTYYLNIEILGSGIQSVPDVAVESAWPAVEVSEAEATRGQLVAKVGGATE